LDYATIKSLSTKHTLTQIIGASETQLKKIQHQALQHPKTCYLPHLAYTTLNPSRSLLQQLQDIAPTADKAALLQHFEKFGITSPLIHASPRSLSIGWQQISAICIALYHAHQLVIAEHVLASLSLSNQYIVLDFLQSYSKVTPVVLLVPHQYPFTAGKTLTISLKAAEKYSIIPSSPPSSKSTTPHPVLSLHNVTLSPYGSPLIRNACLQLNAQEHIGLIGENGCGKSSLCLAIMQHLPYCGEMYLQQTRIKQPSQIYSQQAIALVPQQTQELFDPLLPIHTSLSLANLGLPEIHKALKMFDLSQEALNAYPYELLAIQLKSLAVIRAVLRNPHVLLLDEPYSQACTTWAQQLHQFLRKHQQSVIVVDHNVSLLRITTHRLYQVHNGALHEA
jgi:ABC-type glutathione transport system ATPase component